MADLTGVEVLRVRDRLCVERALAYTENDGSKVIIQAILGHLNESEHTVSSPRDQVAQRVRHLMALGDGTFPDVESLKLEPLILENYQRQYLLELSRSQELRASVNP